MGGSGGGVELGPNSSSVGAGASTATAAESSARAGAEAGINGEGREHAQDSMLAHLLREFHPEFIGASFFCVRVRMHFFGLQSGPCALGETLGLRESMIVSGCMGDFDSEISHGAETVNTRDACHGL